MRLLLGLAAAAVAFAPAAQAGDKGRHWKPHDGRYSCQAIGCTKGWPNQKPHHPGNWKPHHPGNWKPHHPGNWKPHHPGVGWSGASASAHASSHAWGRGHASASASASASAHVSVQSGWSGKWRKPCNARC
jgi:hypothetical protein